MCLAQGPQRSDAGAAKPAAPRSRAKHSTTEPMHPGPNVLQRSVCETVRMH